MHVEHAPPVSKGVTQLQYVGDYNPSSSNLARIVQPVGIAAALVWLVSKSPSLKKKAFWVATGSFVVHSLNR